MNLKIKNPIKNIVFLSLLTSSILISTSLASANLHRPNEVEFVFEAQQMYEQLLYTFNTFDSYIIGIENKDSIPQPFFPKTTTLKSNFNSIYPNGTTSTPSALRLNEGDKIRFDNLTISHIERFGMTNNASLQGLYGQTVTAL